MKSMVEKSKAKRKREHKKLYGKDVYKKTIVIKYL
jgi:hypothetical protein